MTRGLTGFTGEVSGVEKRLQFRVNPLRFFFRVRENIYFPEGKASNILRGAFGLIFRSIACVPECPGVRDCGIRASCPYARTFEPSALGEGPSGFADWPRPFVFRASRLDGRTVHAGESFDFDLHLFDMRSPAAAYFVLTFAQLGREGLGPGRGRAVLSEVWQLTEDGAPAERLFDGESFTLREPSPLVLPLTPPPGPVGKLLVRFVSPTELKSGQQVTSRPEFGVLAGRVRDRLSKLKDLYDDGPLPLDFRRFGERAACVRMTRCDVGRVEVMRRSSRTGGVHPIGGFVGEAEYEGELEEFVPFLRAAKWTGVGRQTVWGKGDVELSLP